MKRQIKFGMAVAVLLLLSIGIAAAIPAIPADYSGNVTINSTAAPDGTKVFVQVNKTTGYVYQTNAVSVASGKYLNLMVNVESILEDTDLGMPVRFYIQKPGESKACLASPTTTLFSSGPHTQDITLVIPPPCIAPLTPSTGTPIPTPTPTVTQSSGRGSGSSSSGSSGGGGVVSAEPYSNVAKSEKKDGSLTANKSVLFSFTTPEFAIYQVAIMGKESENDVSVKVEHLKDTSKLVAKPAPGTVYANENVWASTKRIKEVVIRFRVTNAWITSSNVNVQKETIKLLRWSDNDWKALDTTVINSDNNFTYFESKSAGLSSFAVSAVKEGQVPVETLPSTISITPISNNTSTPKKPTPGFGMLVAVLAVSAIYLLRRREG